MPKLERLDITNNKLTELPVMPKLNWLSCKHNTLIEIMPELEKLEID